MINMVCCESTYINISLPIKSFKLIVAAIELTTTWFDVITTENVECSLVLCYISGTISSVLCRNLLSLTLTFSYWYWRWADMFWLTFGPPSEDIAKIGDSKARVQVTDCDSVLVLPPELGSPKRWQLELWEVERRHPAMSCLKRKPCRIMVMAMDEIQHD